ncbi:hypothetical protein [Sporolactobacillus terrae]|uniref:Uncharacterized protein n=1 Tax=Sporolactobacillus terrae TaxID=269673 RepID=A0ABX5QA60_9BACL|nr:hypothetical protein [Sporolactobacillus terrae]QAA23527.1 hypothetical protein C0674_13470 [Sporolactobacillus terrae]QAA26497.1 hypothetical protein C0679_13455 [Sporolactobacillus terrae]
MFDLNKYRRRIIDEIQHLPKSPLDDIAKIIDAYYDEHLTPEEEIAVKEARRDFENGETVSIEKIMKAQKEDESKK